MKVGTISQIGFSLLCFASLVFILFIQSLNLWNLTNINTKIEDKEEEEGEAVEKHEYDDSGFLKRFKSKRKFSIKEIDEISERSEYFKEIFQNQHSKSLLYLKNLTFLIEPNQSIDCGLINNENVQNNEHDDGLNLVIVINSKWSNFDRRRRVRESWLNRDNIIEQICSYQHKISFPTSSNNGPDKLSSGRFSFIRKVEYLFALGKPETTIQQLLRHNHLHKPTYGDDNNDDDDAKQVMIDSRILDEFYRFRDLLVINMYEQYKSMSIKHLSIYKWILKLRHRQSNNHQQNNNSRRTEIAESNEQLRNNEMNNTLVLKCDDDADINLRQLIEFYHQDRERSRIFNELSSKEFSRENIQNNNKNFINSTDKPKLSDTREALEFRNEAGWIMCARFPQDTRVFRTGSGRKWQITRSEYHFDTYPAYCSGLAYLAPLLLIKRLFILSHILLWNDVQKDYMKPLWIDDVFITGILFAALIESDRTRIVSLNAHFCYTRAQQSRRLKSNAPCMVSEVH